MGRNFLETVDTGYRQHAGLLIDFEFVAFARMHFLTVGEPDYEHGVPPIRRMRRVDS
jgi:hypothetical protein